jgi:hypothetical protein
MSLQYRRVVGDTARLKAKGHFLRFTSSFQTANRPLQGSVMESSRHCMSLFHNGKAAIHAVFRIYTWSMIGLQGDD